MKERITRLSQGIIDDKMPQIEILQPQIEAVIPYGSSFHGDIQVRSTNRVSFRGLIYSGDNRISLKQQYFAGESAIISYEVKGKSLRPGEEIFGAFCLVTNGGEFEVPYCFTAGEPGGRTRGAVVTAMDFADLARSDPEKAMKLFGSNEFLMLDFMQDFGNQALYEVLTRGSNIQNSMEEFLLALGVKKAPVYQADTRERRFLWKGEPLTGEVPVIFEGWGHVSLRVRTDSAFVGLKKGFLAEEDFSAAEIGAAMDLPFPVPVGAKVGKVYFRVFPERLHAGRNLGRVIIEGSNYRAEVPVTVAVAEDAGERKKRHDSAAYDRDYMCLMRNMLEISSGRGNRKNHLREMKEAWSRMADMALPDIYQRLWQVEILLLDENRAKAERKLKALQEEIVAATRRDAEAYCFFLYLQMRLEETKESKELFLRVLDSLAGKGQFGPTFAMLRLLSYDPMDPQPKEALNRLRENFRQGLRSPFMYLEACLIYNNHPDLLLHVGTFELQVIWFGVRHGYLVREVAVAAAKLTWEETGYRPLYLRALEGSYKIWQSPEILEGICQLLVRANLREEKYFPWFEKGIVAKVKVPKIREYYLHCLPEGDERPLPTDILEHFSHNAPSDIKARERLYFHVIKECPEESELYKAYLTQMESYAMDQLFKGRVNQEMKAIYLHTLSPDSIDRRIARFLPDVLKSSLVTTDADVRSVAVTCGELVGEKLYPIKDGAVAIPMYTSTYKLALVDAANARYASLPCTVTPLFTREEAAPLLNRCYELLPDLPMLRLAACEQYLQQLDRLSGKGSLSAIRSLEAQIGAEGLRPAYQGYIVQTLIRFFSTSEGDYDEQLLACVRTRNTTEEDRLFLTEALIEKKYFAEASALVRQYGFNGVKIESLAALAEGWSAYLERRQPGKEDPYLTGIAMEVFRQGKETRHILSWLCRYFNGASADMLEILKRSDQFGVNRYDLAGRLLGQKIFSGDLSELDYVFRRYTTDCPEDETIVCAYYVVRCIGYLFEGETIDDEIMGFIRDKVRRNYPNGKMPDILKYAVLKEYAQRCVETPVLLTTEDAALCRGLVEDCCRTGVIFPFFRDLADFVPVPDELTDKIVVGYCGKTNSAPELFYQIFPAKSALDEGEKTSDPPSHTIPMLQSYGSIYYRTILLFEGETLRYEIRVQRDGAIVVAETGTLTASDCGQVGSRFHSFNHLLKMPVDTESEDWLNDVEQFARKDTLVGKIFGLI